MKSADPRSQDGVDIVNSDENSGSSENQSEQIDASGSSGILTLGWREWVSLPELGLPAIKAKIDTGAKTTSVHASKIERFKKNNGEDWVSFTVMPIQRTTNVTRLCEAPLVDIRKVTDSGGHSQDRYFIKTQLAIGGLTREVEITLAQRKEMLFRMLIGRTTLVPGIVVNPQLSYTMGRMNARSLYENDNESS